MSASTSDQPLLGFTCYVCKKERCYLEFDICEPCLWASVQDPPDMRELRELEQRARRHRLAEI